MGRKVAFEGVCWNCQWSSTSVRYVVGSICGICATLGEEESDFKNGLEKLNQLMQLKKVRPWDFTCLWLDLSSKIRIKRLLIVGRLLEWSAVGSVAE